jgi:hypothetical protein
MSLSLWASQHQTQCRHLERQKQPHKSIATTQIYIHQIRVSDLQTATEAGTSPLKCYREINSEAVPSRGCLVNSQCYMFLPHARILSFGLPFSEENMATDEDIGFCRVRLFKILNNSQAWKKLQWLIRWCMSLYNLLFIVVFDPSNIEKS